MKFFRYLVPPLIVVAALVGFSGLMAMKKEPPKEEGHQHEQAVEVFTAHPSTEALSLDSQGLVEATRSTTLSAEVTGRIVRVSPKFHAGEVFQEAEVLLEIDSADYIAILTQAEASLANAKLALANEQAKADQAQRDWSQLGGTQPPTDLVLRKPHLASAQAQLKAAEASLIKAHRDLDRTQVKAPYTGRLRAKYTELGAVLAPGTRIADLYATSSYQLRLPISLEDYPFLDAGSKGKPITLRTQGSSGQQQQWKATFQRTEGEVDRSSRSLFIVAELPASSEDSLLKPGLFVHASIPGRTLENIYRIPRRAFLDETHLLIADPQTGRLHHRQVTPLRTAGADVLVTAGLKDGEKVITTALSAPIDGMTVKILPETSSTPDHK